MKLKYSILFALLLSPPSVMAVDKKIVYGGENVFTEDDSCLVVDETVLTLKERFRRFLVRESHQGVPPTTGEVSRIISTTKIKENIGFGPNHSLNDVAVGTPLWEEVRCFFAHHVSHDHDQRENILASLTPEYKSRDGRGSSFGVVVRNLPAYAWVLQGLGEPVSMPVKNNPYIALVRHLVTDACYAPDSRVEVSKSSTLHGRTIVQLVIGRAKKVSLEKRAQIIKEESKQYDSDHYNIGFPDYKKKLIAEIEAKDFFESAEICQFYLDGKRVLRNDTSSHVSGTDRDWGHEVQLDSGDWPYLREDSLGFISLDEGKNWDRVFSYTGMESMSVSIESLENAPVTYWRGGMDAGH